MNKILIATGAYCAGVERPASACCHGGVMGRSKQLISLIVIPDYESGGREFESLRARQFNPLINWIFLQPDYVSRYDT